MHKGGGCHLPGLRCLLHSIPLNPTPPPTTTIKAGSRGPKTSSPGSPKDPTPSASPPSPHRGLERGRGTQDPGLQLRALSPRRGPSKPIPHAGSLSLRTLQLTPFPGLYGSSPNRRKCSVKRKPRQLSAGNLEVMNSWERYWKTHPRTAWGFTWQGRGKNIVEINSLNFM